MDGKNVLKVGNAKDAMENGHLRFKGSRGCKGCCGRRQLMGSQKRKSTMMDKGDSMKAMNEHYAGDAKDAGAWKDAGDAISPHQWSRWK